MDKTYFAKVKGNISDDVIEKFMNGFKVDNELTALPARLEVLDYNKEDNYSEVYVTVHEGKFHQIKRMFAAVDSEVLFLKRVTFGPLSLDKSLKQGEFRPLNVEEISALKNN